jgi:hypothetical protein
LRPRGVRALPGSPTVPVVPDFPGVPEALGAASRRGLDALCDDFWGLELWGATALGATGAELGACAPAAPTSRLPTISNAQLLARTDMKVPLAVNRR